MKILCQGSLIKNQNILVCEACNSDVHIYLANENILELRPDSKHEDRWICCSNESCCYHYGEGQFQTYPDWVIVNGKSNIWYDEKCDDICILCESNIVYKELEGIKYKSCSNEQCEHCV